jgi:hypothetical protein
MLRMGPETAEPIFITKKLTFPEGALNNIICSCFVARKVLPLVNMNGVSRGVLRRNPHRYRCRRHVY